MIGRRGILGIITVGIVSRRLALAQSVPTIGYLSALSEAPSKYLVAAFLQGLRGRGYVEGQNVFVEYRWAENDCNKLPGFAADLVNRKVALIAATGGLPAPLAAKRASGTIPIVFTIGDDPTKYGLAESYNRPGGNATGVMLLAVELDPKRVELIKDLLPNAKTIAMLVDPGNLQSEIQSNEIQSFARKLDMEIILYRTLDDHDFERAFSQMPGRHDAVLIGASGVFTSRRKQIVELADRYKVPRRVSTARVCRCWRFD